MSIPWKGKMRFGSLAVRLFVIAAVGALLVSACSRGDEAAPPAPADPTPTPLRTAAPTEAGGLLVASPDGIEQLAADGSSVKLTDTPATVAFPAGDDIVFQELSDESLLAAPIRTGAGAPFDSEDILVEAQQETVALILHGVASIGGRHLAVVTEVTGNLPEDQTEWLSIVDVSTGEQADVAETGGWEDWTSQATFDGDRFVLYAMVSATGYTSYLSTTGEPLDEPHDPLPNPCNRAEEVACPANVVTDPDGRRLAWIAEDERPNGTFFTRVFVVDRSDGNEVLSAELPQGSGLSRLELKGDRLIVNPWNTTAAPHFGPVPPLVFDLTNDDGPVELTVDGYATFDRDR